MRRVEHPAAQQLAGLMEPRRIDYHYLGVGIGANPDDPPPRRLRLRSDNRDFLADDAVEQAGFADVRAPGQRKKTGAMNR
jgi:hypothetical protein